MDKVELFNQIFQLCIVPLLGVLTTFAVQFFRTKIAEMKVKEENEKILKYLDILDQVVEECVIATNQTYVEAMKDKDAFDIEAQRSAFIMTSEAIYSIMSEEAMNVLQLAFDDLDELIRQKIEAEVNKNK